MHIKTFSLKGFLFLGLMLLVLSLPRIVTAAPEQRTALVIGNGGYSTGSLKNPVNDADDMASALKRLGFSVILKKNATQQDMEDAIRAFGNRLKKGGVGLFFYAGHGVQISGKNFLLPIGVKIDSETDVKYRAVDADMVLDEMGNAGNPMNIVILDACRDNPFGKNFRTASRGLAIISSAPRGTLISYSTSPGNVASDGSGRNSPYAGSLMKHMMTPILPIEEVFKNVRQDLGKMTKGKQIPWELSSLEGRFYFNEQSGSGRDVATEGKRLDDERQRIAQERDLLEKERALEEEKEKLEALKREQVKQAPLAVEALEQERQEVTWQKQEIEGQKALNTEREQMAAERRTLEAVRQQLAMEKRISDSSGGETARDGQFIAYNNGAVWDTKTNLMWASKDNGSDINWGNAKSYCENYRGGGYTDWRMPTQDELAGLYDKAKYYEASCLGGQSVHLTKLISLTCNGFWASETRISGTTFFFDRTSEAAYFVFSYGSRGWQRLSYGLYHRALPVRSVK